MAEGGGATGYELVAQPGAIGYCIEESNAAVVQKEERHGVFRARFAFFGSSNASERFRPGTRGESGEMSIYAGLRQFDRRVYSMLGSS